MQAGCRHWRGYRETERMPRQPPTCPSASGVSSVASEAGCEAAAGGSPLPWLLLPRPPGALGSVTLRANPNCVGCHHSGGQCQF